MIDTICARRESIYIMSAQADERPSTAITMDTPPGHLYLAFIGTGITAARDIMDEDIMVVAVGVVAVVIEGVPAGATVEDIAVARAGATAGVSAGVSAGATAGLGVAGFVEVAEGGAGETPAGNSCRSLYTISSIDPSAIVGAGTNNSNWPNYYRFPRTGGVAK